MGTHTTPEKVSGMSRDSRIKLAEAMGWEWQQSSDPLIGRWSFGGMTHDYGLWHHYIPDPENDANDDYAVLEWMRKEREGFSTCYLLTTRTRWSYQIGDYARAALEVLDTAPRGHEHE